MSLGKSAGSARLTMELSQFTMPSEIEQYDFGTPKTNRLNVKPTSGLTTLLISSCTTTAAHCHDLRTQWGLCMHFGQNPCRHHLLAAIWAAPFRHNRMLQTTFIATAPPFLSCSCAIKAPQLLPCQLLSCGDRQKLLQQPE